MRTLPLLLVFACTGLKLSSDTTGYEAYLCHCTSSSTVGETTWSSSGDYLVCSPPGDLETASVAATSQCQPQFEPMAWGQEGCICDPDNCLLMGGGC